MGKTLISIKRNKGLITIVLLVIALLIPSFSLPTNTEALKKNDDSKVLAKVDFKKNTPSLTLTPLPTISLSTTTTLPVLTSTPTPTSTTTSTTTTTIVPTQAQSTSTPTVTITLTPTVVPTETLTPTPQGSQVQIGVDYAGQRSADSYTPTVTEGQSAWDVVVSAVGLGNLQYADYGGDMGIFITGFNDINAASNQYFEFRVNGASSNVGVSSYKCNSGDKLDFVLMSF